MWKCVDVFCVSGVPPETDPGQMIDRQRRDNFGKDSRNTKIHNIGNPPIS